MIWNLPTIYSISPLIQTVYFTRQELYCTSFLIYVSCIQVLKSIQVPVSRFLYQGLSIQVSVNRFLYPSFRIQVSVSRFLYPGFCIQVSVSRFLYPGFCIQVYVSRFMFPGLCFQVYVSRFMYPGFCIQVSVSRVPYPAFRIQVSVSRCLLYNGSDKQYEDILSQIMLFYWVKSMIQNEKICILTYNFSFFNPNHQKSSPPPLKNVYL